MLQIRRILTVLLLLVSTLSYSQHSISIPNEINHFKTGKECFDNQQYTAAVYHFQSYLEDDAAYDERQVEAQYYIIYANLYLKKAGVESEIMAFVSAHEGTYMANQLAYELGRFYFAKEDYRNAVKAFSNCKESFFTAEQLPFYYYEWGYAYFATKKYRQAKPLFKSTITLGKAYADEALYYYSYLQYKDENYNIALEGFETLYNKGLFEASVPMYMAQIYFIKEDYDQLIAFAPALLSIENSENQVELNRILGDAYYKLRDYDKAIGYLEAYQNATPKILRQDLYHLGVAYYMKEDYQHAAETLAQITAQNDPLSQSAYSYLGECFVKMGDKERACLAFGTASKYKFDPALREDAYYNYVKLSYETSVSPFSGTIALLEGFLEEFPESNYTLEIYDLMYKSFMTTTNYKEACLSIEKLKNKDQRLVFARQRVMYYRGVELYNAGRYKEAISYFQKSLEGNPREKTLKALALYWSGDAYYQMGNYQEAFNSFEAFIVSSGAYSLDEFAMAHYNMGYSLFKLHRYSDAITWFRKFTQLNKAIDKHWMTDAYNRTGDCFFLKKDYYNAIRYYSQAIDRNGDGTDYAYYQKGFCQGMLEQYNPQIVTMTSLLKVMPQSPYADDALYEIARTRMLLGQSEEAIKAYQQLPVSYPNSKYAAQAMLNAGLAYYNMDNLAQATATYKQVVDRYQGSEEAHSALLALKNISIEQNSVDEYIAYAKAQGVDDMQKQEQDSLNFIAAERMYMSQRYDEAITAFNTYINKFPNGAYSLVAYFYMADAYMQTNQMPQAMQALEYIVSQPRSIYTEQALAVLSATYYNEKLYAKALDTYKRLLENAEQKENILNAKIGIMDCNYALGEAGATILAVDDLMLENLSSVLKNKALYYKGKSYLALDNPRAAKVSFELLAQDFSNAYGAEAKYWIAKMYFDEQDMDAAKNEIYDFINIGTSEQYWLAKAFILLSDIFVAEGDLFQAKQYLLSISDNYKQDDDILSIVSAKLDAIVAQEERENQSKRDALGTHFVEPNDSLN